MKKMKKIALFVLVVALPLCFFAQVKKTTAVANPHLKVFELSAESGDAVTAISALNYYIAEKGANNDYVDTLALLYMQQGAVPQCYYWTMQRLKQKPNDLNLREMQGFCLEKLKQPKEAIDVFEKLFDQTKKPSYAYKLMELQYGMKRLAECLATAQQAEKLEYKPQYLMTYSVGDQLGRTYLQAGMYNIYGLTLYELGKKEDAKKCFEKALSLDSTFELAKQNLATLVNIDKGGTPPMTKQAQAEAASPAKKP